MFGPDDVDVEDDDVFTVRGGSVGVVSGLAYSCAAFSSPSDPVGSSSEGTIFISPSPRGLSLARSYCSAVSLSGSDSPLPPGVTVSDPEDVLSDTEAAFA